MRIPKLRPGRAFINYLLVGTLSLNVLATGLPALLDQYAQQQARIPRPLTSQDLPASPVAADAAPATGKAPALPDDVEAQLEADRKVMKEGKPRDRTRVATLDEGRTPTDTVYKNADGTKTLVKSFDTTSYKDAEGKWQTVDSTLKQDKADQRWKSTANDWQARFGTSASAGVELAKGDKAVTSKPAGGTAVEPVVTGTGKDQKVTYRNVWQGIDLQYSVSGSGIKEDIIIKSRAAANTFKFDLAGATLAPYKEKERTGWYQLEGPLSGFVLPAPTVATQTEGVVGADPYVSQAVTPGGLTITLDQKWLKEQPTEAFPIVVDPTFASASAVNDGYINYKSDGFICYAGQGCGNSTGSISNNYWRFAYHVDYSAAAGEGKIIREANFHVEMPNCTDSNYGTCSGHSIETTRYNGNFCFSCVSVGQPTVSQWNGASFDMNVTALYRDRANLGVTDDWFMVKGEEAQGNYMSYKFFAHDRTQVWFNYDNQPPVTTQIAPANGATVVTTVPALTTTAVTDADGDKVWYRYTVGTNPDGSGIVSSSNWTTTQWNLPDNVLQDGTTYYWKVETWDALGADVPPRASAVRSFKVDLRTGKDATQTFDTTGPLSTDLATGNLTTSAKSHSISALGGSLGVSLDYNSPQRSRQGLVGEFWNDPSGSAVIPGTPATMTRVDPNINFDWGSGTPSSGIVTTDNFLARWTGYFVAPVAGNYTFHTQVDDRCKITVNNNVVLDSWSTYCGTKDATPVALTAGQIVPIKMEFGEITGAAVAILRVKGAVTDQVVPSEWLQTGIRPTATPHGLIGRYFTGSSFPGTESDTSTQFLTRTDPTPSLDWASGSPVPNGPVDNFVVRWSGFFKAPQAGSYKFGAQGDDGIKIIANSSTQVDLWSSGATATPTWASSSISMTAGQTIPISVEYKETTGSANLGLFVDGPGIDKDLPVPSEWLVPKAQVLPDGWNLGVDADGDLGYDFATIGQTSVVLRDSTGDTHEYKFANGGFTPPVNEAGHMVRNGDGTITLQDSDGRTYVFNTDGTLKLSTNPVDDRTPAALQYSYTAASNSAIPTLTQITDGVTSARWAKVLYSGDSSCPTYPSGFVGVPAGMICAVTTSDGQMTKLHYANDPGGVPRLYRLEHPGAEITDYEYDSLGRVVSLRDSLANDAITAGVRTQDATLLTAVTYDAIGRASTITMPAASSGATRQARNYEYQSSATPAHTKLHITGATEPSGYSRKITYDGTYRTLSDFDVAALETVTQWDAVKDLTLATTDPAGLKSTTIYDEDDRPLHQYGPAPSAWYDANRIPLTTPTNYTSQVPHNQTGYDETILGLAAAYYDVKTSTNGTGVSTKLLFGAPRSHQTGVGPSSGDVVKNWGATQPVTPTVNTYGWGVRLSGAIKLAETGNHTFKIKSDDGARLWIDDVLTTDDWTDGSYRDHATGIYANATANTWHRIRIDYYNKAVSTTLDTDAHLELFKTAPGGSETSVLGSLLTPRYGLATSQKTYDSSSAVGDVTTTTSYGANPELGLATSSTLDSAGLNYTTSSAYETPGTGSFLRQTSKTLPGGTVTGYSYYTATDTKDNPCTAGTTEAYKQAGMLKLKTEADPDNNAGTTTAGVNAPRTTETIYDDAGRIVATRYNADSWTCTTYDTRGRVTTVAIPAFGSAAARTVTNVWAVGSNPLIVSSADAQGTISTTSDLLGRTTSYTDANGQTTTTSYDTLGRLSSRSGPLGTEDFVYDNYNRLTSQKLDSVVQATPSYDAYGRLASVAYPTAGSLGQTLSRDSLGRTTGTSYTLGNGSTGPSDAVTRSQSGQIISGTELGQAKSYTYDKAGRLTAATIGSHSYAYSFGTPTGCTGTYNVNSGKNANRSSQTIDSVTTNFCYDYADRLISSSDSSVTTPTYDAHGNTTQLGSGTTTAFAYDSSDRNSSITEGIKSTAFTRDVQNRIIKRAVAAPATGLPTPWLTQDVGSPTLPGSAAYSGSTFTLKGAGTDVWEEEDQSRYVYQALTGNGQIIARLTSQSNTGEWAKAGITIKDSTTTHSNYVSIHATPSHGVRMQWNYEDDVDGGSYTSGNTWLKLTRSGDLVHTYKSSNGTSWTEVDVVEISLPNTATVGLYVSSLSPTTLGTATFDNVSVTQTGSTLPAGWATGEVGDPDTYGSASYSGSTFTIAGAGIDVWEGEDQFRYVYQSLSGNGQIVARIKSQTNTGDWAKAGVVIKASPAAHTEYASIHTTPGADMRMQWNYEDDVDAGSYTFPNAWVKLVRVGNTITTYKSTNGTSWTEIDSATVALPESVSIGLFVSSTNPNATSTATFDNVSVTTNTTNTDYKYGFTSSGDTPDLLMNAAGTVTEKYFQLPGGVLLTKRPTSSIFSLVNVHGDVLATTDAAGAQTGTFQYDPFGNKISSTLPDNTTGGSTYGWVGQHEKGTEKNIALQPMEMGARVYLAKIGRFLSVDPIEGGTSNNYVYPPNPVGDEDFSGEAQRGTQSNQGKQLSSDEKRALQEGKNKNNSRAYESAKKKIQYNEKVAERSRNNQKRLNMIKNAGKRIVERAWIFILIPVTPLFNSPNKKNIAYRRIKRYV